LQHCNEREDARDGPAVKRSADFEALQAQCVVTEYKRPFIRSCSGVLYAWSARIQQMGSAMSVAIGEQVKRDLEKLQELQNSDPTSLQLRSLLQVPSIELAEFKNTRNAQVAPSLTD
jgi:hypothetical protein